ERREKERLEAERKERERLEAERREKERLEAERKERERLDAERREKERLEAERKERERLDAVRREKERLEAERKNEERREQEEIAARAAADESAEIGGSSKRRKRDKSARSKKDRLRSSAPAPAPAPPQPVAAAAPPASKSGWLVPPDRAAAFEAPVPQPTAPDVTRSFPVYVPPAVPPVQAMPSVAPTPVVMAPPAAVPAPASAPIPIGFAPPKPAVPQHAAPIAVAQPAPIRLKHEAAAPPANYSPRRDREVALAPAGEISANPTDGPSGGGIPWKLAAAAGVVLVIGIAGARFMPSGSRTPGPQPTTTTASKAPAPTPAPSATAGQVIISTDPPGARVLLDGKTVGESPVTLPTVPPGRHTITLVTESGSVKRAVRVEAGKTLTVDVPIFSGFVAVSAPIIVEIAEAGRLLGTSENQVMLSPGRHQLRFTNRALHYEATQTVEIEPGEVFKLGLDPRGTANINAVPWAEVWIDGVKAGETPIANVSIPLGVREIVFRNPQFGERKVTTTVTGGPPAALSVDFTKH
ncbi:MAG: PEGA domain-containing protein, partial [Acidobacteria bacterium]|nr:PEGA domain-containing protein [Acidobacteriota bacterium]